MNIIRPEFIYFAIVVIIPGFISQAVFNALVARGKGRQHNYLYPLRPEGRRLPDI